MWHGIAGRKGAFIFFVNPGAVCYNAYICMGKFIRYGEAGLMNDGSKFSLRYYAVLREKKRRVRMQMI